MSKASDKKLREISNVLKEFTEGVRWRRDLTVAEKRVKFDEVNQIFDTFEERMVFELADVLRRVLDKLSEDIRAVLESSNYIDFEKIVIGYHGKLVNIVKKNLQAGFLIGQSEVYEELEIEKDPVRSVNYMHFYNAQAEAYITELEGKIKARAILLALNGVMLGRPIDSIVKQIKEGEK